MVREMIESGIVEPPNNESIVTVNLFISLLRSTNILKSMQMVNYKNERFFTIGGVHYWRFHCRPFLPMLYIFMFHN